MNMEALEAYDRQALATLLDTLEEFDEVTDAELNDLARAQAASWGIDKVLAEQYGCEWVR